MRVTNGMIASQTLFNLSRSLNEFMNIQVEMSTGRRLNKPSDDPIGVQRGLEYRNQLKRLTQYNTNISLGINVLAKYEATLTSMNNLVRQAKDIALAVTDATNNSPEARPAYLNEISSALDRLIQLANVELDGRRIMAGHRTDVNPLIGSANGVTYVGDTGAMIVEIDRTSNVQLNINAAEVLLERLVILGADADLLVGVTGATSLSELQNGNGVDLNTMLITDNNTGVTVSVGLTIPAPAVSMDDVISQINTQLTAGGINGVTATVGPDRNIVLTAVSTGQVSLLTPLTNLNGGSGVELVPGTISVKNPSGTIDFELDLSGSATFGDAISAINAQLIANGVNNVTAGLNGAGTGIDIVDTNGVSLDLTFGAPATGITTARDLGILGTANPTLNGGDLTPTRDITVTEGAGTTATDLGLQGTFNVSLAGEDLSPQMTLNTPLSLLNNGNGYKLGTISLTQGANTRIIDFTGPGIVTVGDAIVAINTSGLNITAGLNSSGRGIQIVSDSATESFLIENDGSTSTASALGIFGSSDLMGAVIGLRNILSQDAVAGSPHKNNVESLMKTIQAGMSRLLSARGAIGSKQNRLESTASQLSSTELETIKLLSEVEDADITELVTRLATHENNYQAGLIATARIIQPTLMDFLR